MRKIFALLCLIPAVYTLSMAQSKNLEHYRTVDIDSVWRAPISLPEDKPYVIENIEFSILSKDIIDLGKTGGTTRDRFFQFNELSKSEYWEYKVGSIYYRVNDSLLLFTFSNRSQFLKVLKAFKDTTESKLTIKAKMLIGKFERYNLPTRDFLIKDVEVLANR